MRPRTEREAPRQMGIIARSKGPYFSPISLKAGHGPEAVKYPVSLVLMSELHPKLQNI